jgi:hypothetical protein
MSGANTINLTGGTFTLNFSTYTDPGGNSVPGPVVVNNAPGNESIDITVSWAYVTNSATPTIYSLLIQGFTQGNTLDYTPAGGLTANGGQDASLLTLEPNGSPTLVTTSTVDNIPVYVIEAPVVEVTADSSGSQSSADTDIAFLLAPGPSALPFSVSYLHLSSDGAGGVDITSTQPCYRAGTRIRTPGGEVAIEELRPGDLVLTARGQAPTAQPVAWIGHRTVDCTAHPRPWDVRPVRVQAHAFAPGRPERDLWLSPDHAVFADGVLIPVRYLLNGASVAQCDVGRVAYYHLELPRHDVVLAEGLPAESFLDTGNRAAFANGGAVVQATPDFARRIWDAAACAPLVTAGPDVVRVRRRLIARLPALGHALTTDPRPAFLLDDAPAQARRFGEGWWSVALAPASGTLRLLSRAARPADFDPAAEDTRLLGVALLALRLDGRDVALSAPIFGAGWHASEGALRWTGGDAAIDVTGARLAELRLASWIAYLDDALSPRGSRALKTRAGRMAGAARSSW